MFTGIAGIAGFTGTAAGGAPAFVPTDLGAKLLAWWDPTDLTTLDKAGPVPVTTVGDAVLNFRDKSGNANNFQQGTAGSRPTYQVDGSGNPYLLFDGSNDSLNSSFGPTLPFERISALQQVTWVAGDYIWGTTTATRPGSLQQNGAGVSPSISLLDGSNPNTLNISSLAVGSNGVVTERHIAGASQITVDNGSYTTANVGSTNAGQMILGAVSTAGGNAGNIRFYGAVVCNGTLTAGEIASLRTYLGNKCGLTL